MLFRAIYALLHILHVLWSSVVAISSQKSQVTPCRFYTQEHCIDRLSRFVHVKHNMNRTYPYFWHMEKSISFILFPVLKTILIKVQVAFFLAWNTNIWAGIWNALLHAKTISIMVTRYNDDFLANWIKSHYSNWTFFRRQANEINLLQRVWFEASSHSSFFYLVCGIELIDPSLFHS